MQSEMTLITNIQKRWPDPNNASREVPAHLVWSDHDLGIGVFPVAVKQSLYFELEPGIACGERVKLPSLIDGVAAGAFLILKKWHLSYLQWYEHSLLHCALLLPGVLEEKLPVQKSLDQGQECLLSMHPILQALKHCGGVQQGKEVIIRKKKIWHPLSTV